ncbi:hypothetical protein [Streptomyces cucumeris]|uniref:hypothetical protein n=1 Tax=Streptomyces cucumeris TaxID=2962890 RepID=UPI003D70850A
MVADQHGGLTPAAPFPPGVARFADARLRRTLAFGGLLRDAEGVVVGYGTELETLLPESTPEPGIMRSRGAWLLHLPGRGTIFHGEVEDKTDVAATIFQPALESGKPWVGDRSVVSTVGPGKGGRGVVGGGTEEFEGIRGRGAERARVRRFDPVALVMEATFELRFRCRLPRWPVRAVRGSGPRVRPPRQGVRAMIKIGHHGAKWCPGAVMSPVTECGLRGAFEGSSCWQG